MNLYDYVDQIHESLEWTREADRKVSKFKNQIDGHYYVAKVNLFGHHRACPAAFLPAQGFLRYCTVASLQMLEFMNQFMVRFSI